MHTMARPINQEQHMPSRIAVVLLAAALSAALVRPAKADTVQLSNGDVLRGKVVSLGEKQLVFRSESFGEIKIERAKVDLIALGNKPLPSARQTAGAPAAAPAPAADGGLGSLLGGIAPLLGGASAQKGLSPGVDQLLGAGGLGDLQKNVDTARRGLQDLKKDLGNGPDSQALDAYINLLNQFGPIAAAAGQGAPTKQPPPRRVEPPRARPAVPPKPPAPATKPANP
jgi:hypothetical protein